MEETQTGKNAEKYFLEGYNCAQAVVLALKDYCGLSEDALKKAVIGFGGGIGRQRLTCGAVSGMVTALGLALSDGENKGEIYALVREACEKFKNETGSIICGELLSGVKRDDSSPEPESRTEAYYKKRPCALLCALAGDIAQEIISNAKTTNKDE